MGNPPDAAALVAAVAELRQLVAAAFASPRPPDGEPAAWSQLAGQAQQIDARARWCRDATVAIARRAGASWDDLERHTGVADATLHSRLRRFLYAEERFE